MHTLAETNIAYLRENDAINKKLSNFAKHVRFQGQCYQKVWFGCPRNACFLQDIAFQWAKFFVFRVECSYRILGSSVHIEYSSRIGKIL